MTIAFCSRQWKEAEQAWFKSFYLFRSGLVMARAMQEEDFNRDFYRAVVSDVLHAFKSVMH